MANLGTHGILTSRRVFIPGYGTPNTIGASRNQDYQRLPVLLALPMGVLTGQWGATKAGATVSQASPFAGVLSPALERWSYPMAAIPDVQASVRCGHEWQQMGMGAAVGQGTPAPLVIPRAGVFRFRVGLVTNPQTISIWVKQASNTAPRPKMVILEDGESGVSRQEVVAGTGTGWVEMTCSVSSTGTGRVVWVELYNRHLNYDPAYFGRQV